MAMPMSMPMPTEEVVAAFQEEEHDDASKCSESIECMKEVDIAARWDLHADSLYVVRGKNYQYISFSYNTNETMTIITMQIIIEPIQPIFFPSISFIYFTYTVQFAVVIW